MKTHPLGIRIIKAFEKLVLHAYDDKDPMARPVKPGQKVRGTLTIGWGHTGPDVVPGLVITPERAEELLRQDVEEAEAIVDRRLSAEVRARLTEHQYAALVSLAYNAGAKPFLWTAGLKRRLEEGRLELVPSELPKWRTSDGEIMPGLVRRRAVEAVLFDLPGQLDLVRQHPGAWDDPARALQALLFLAGFDPGAIDGEPGRKTRAAVVAFQRSVGLEPDGLPGRQTAEALGIVLLAEASR